MRATSTDTVPNDAARNRPDRTGAAAGSSDPYAALRPAHPARFLYRLNPLAKVAAPLPVMVLLIFTRGIAIPLAMIVLAVLLLVVGARLSGRVVAALLLGVPVALLVLGASFGLWIDPAQLEAADPSTSVVLLRVGDWSFTLGAYLLGFATAVRVAALFALALIGGLTTSGVDLVRAMVQNLRVPYRIGYTALAGFRFVPRFGHELEIIRAAHRVRGADAGRGPIAAVRRTLGYAVPLLASAIRHAERVALAMDSRAFGAHRTRTERTLTPWRIRDTVFVLAFWAIAVAVYAWAFHAGLGGFADDRARVTIR